VTGCKQSSGEKNQFVSKVELKELDNLMEKKKSSLLFVHKTRQIGNLTDNTLML
jgi:hypothetical protein